MIYDELPSSWRFVDDQKKLTKNKGCYDCSGAAPIVATNIDTLPSFIWRTTNNFFTPLSFLLIEDGGSTIDLASEIPNIELFTIGSYTYVAYNTTTFSSTPLSTGIYYAKIWDGLHFIYSEPIRICDDNTRCIKFDWTNICDLAGIPYSHLNTVFGTPFINSFSVTDMSLIFPEYETEKEKFENMLRQTDNFYLSQTRTFSVRFSEPVGVPDWFVRSIQVMQLHSDISIVYDSDNNHQNGLYTADIEECTVTSSQNEDMKCGSKLEIKFRQDDAVITTSCCVNSEPEPCLESCYDVIGFKDDVTPTLGQFAIDDFDSGVIVQWSIVNTWVPVSFDCTYVYNTDTSTHMFYNGDLWRSTPDVTSVSVVLVQGNLVTLQVFGYAMPGTFVQVGSSAFEGGCDYSTGLTFTAEQLIAGDIAIVIDTDTYYFVCIKSFDHNCEYDTRQIHFEL